MSQNTIIIPTVSPLPGATFLTDLNASLASVMTLLSGASAPTTGGTGLTALADTLWNDLTNNQLRLRDHADTTYMPWLGIDQTNKLALALTRSGLAGFTTSNNGGAPNTGIDFAQGAAASDDNTDIIFTTAAITNKGINANWAAGSSAGMLDTGAVAPGWYHLFGIHNPASGVADFLASLSVSAPTMPSGYTKKRRLASILVNGSSHIVAYTQNGDEFLWKAPTIDMNGVASSATPSTPALTVPPGLKVNVLFNGQLNFSSSGVGVLFSAPDQAIAATSGIAVSLDVTNTTVSEANGQFNVRTSTTQTIGVVSSGAGCTVSISTLGWIDSRGKYN